MSMSETLRNNLLKCFPDGKIYEDKITEAKHYSLFRAICKEKEASEFDTIADFINNNGFLFITIERCMDHEGIYLSKGIITDIVDSIYDTQRLLGSVKLSDEKQEELFQYSRNLFIKVINRQGQLSLQEKKILLLEAIYMVQKRDMADDEQDGEEENSSLWSYLFRELSGNIMKSGTAEYTYCYNFFCSLIRDILDRTNHLRILPQKGKNKYQQYYDTLLVHAQAPKTAMFRFFRILFDFYVDGLECQYISKDPAFKQLRDGIKSKWNENFEAEVDVRSEPMGACIRTMFDFCPNFSVSYCEHLIQKMDALTSGTMELLTSSSYIDCLLMEWYQSQSRDKKNAAWIIRNEHHNDRIATEEKQIVPYYEWNSQKGVCICIPKIRFGQEICEKIQKNQGLPFVRIFCDEYVIHEENLKFFVSQGVYTSRGYQFDFGNFLTRNFQFRIMIGIGDQPNCIYDSQKNGKELLFRNMLLFDESGHEMQTIQDFRHNQITVFVPGNSVVSFEPESEEIREESVGFLKCYQFDIDNIHAFSIDGQDVYADETARNHFRVQISSVKMDNARILSDNKYFDIYSELQNITFLLPDQAYPEQYQLISDGKMSPLSLYCKDGAACPPITNEPGLHEIRIVEVGPGTTVSSVRYAVLPGFRCDFEENVYFDVPKEVKITVSWGTDYQKHYDIHVNAGIISIQLAPFPYGDFLEVDIPVIHGTFRGENLFEYDQRNPIWHENISRGSHIHITYPKGWVPSLWLGNNIIHHVSRDVTTFDIGNQLESYRTIFPKEELILRLDHHEKSSVFYKICSIAFLPLIQKEPVLFENNSLYWNIEDCYIGDKNAQFHLILNAGEEEYTYALTCKNEIVEKNSNLPDGEYLYRIEVIEKIPFLGEKCTEIYSGNFIIGDPNAFRFANSALYLKTASYWIDGIGENEKFGLVTLKPESTRICNMNYLGMKNTPTGDGPFPCYCGTLQFWNQRAEDWWNFNFSHEKENQYQRINPIRFWLVSDHIIEIKPADRDTLDIELDYQSIRKVPYDLLPEKRKKQVTTPDSFDYEIRKEK